MRTGIIFIVLVLALILGGAVWYVVRQAADLPGTVGEVAALPTSPKDAAYIIDGLEVKFEGGQASKEFGEETGNDPSFTVEYAYVGEPVPADINGDGIKDALGIVVAERGGSGSFYYAVAALSNGAGYLGTNGILLGDRIATPVVSFVNDLVYVRYRVHAEGEPMASTPTLEQVTYLTLSGIELQDAGPVAGEDVYEGRVVREAEGYTFERCIGEALPIHSESRSYAAIEAVFAERSKGTTSSAVFFVLSGREGETDTEEGALQAFEATGILAAPKEGRCTGTQAPLEGEADDPAEADVEATSTDDLTGAEGALE